MRRGHEHHPQGAPRGAPRRAPQTRRSQTRRAPRRAPARTKSPHRGAPVTLVTARSEDHIPRQGRGWSSKPPGGTSHRKPRGTSTPRGGGQPTAPHRHPVPAPHPTPSSCATIIHNDETTSSIHATLVHRLPMARRPRSNPRARRLPLPDPRRTDMHTNRHTGRPHHPDPARRRMARPCEPPRFMCEMQPCPGGERHR